MFVVLSAIKENNHLYIVTEEEKISAIEIKIGYMLGRVQTKILVGQKGSIFLSKLIS